MENPSEELIQGFTLIELAISLMVLGLILSLGLPAASQAIGREPKRQTLERLALAKTALLGFLMTKGRFPCPTSSETNFGSEVMVGQRCQSEQGFLPASTLGVQGLDGWGQPIRYAVSGAFAQTLSLGTKSAFTLETEGTLSITESQSKAFVVVIFSTGQHTRSQSVDEQNNLDGDSHFVQKKETEDFDDLLESINAYSAKARLLEVGRLP